MRVIDTYVSPQYTIKHDPGDAWDGQTLDRTTFQQRVLYSRNAFPDLNFAIQEMVEEGEQVVVFWIMSGTHNGDLPNLPATGRAFSISGITIYYFDSDKLCGHSSKFYVQMCTRTRLNLRPLIQTACNWAGGYTTGIRLFHANADGGATATL
jgi:steroid delta-isomerase-like uncharacterized protein